jgi:hypothetical protein
MKAIAIGLLGHIKEVNSSQNLPVSVYKIVSEKRILLSEHKQINGQSLPDLSPNATVHAFTLRANGKWIRQGDQINNGDTFILSRN